MNLVETINAEFERNYSVLLMELKGITHAESMIQPPFQGNCLNWIVGHMVASRGTVFRLCGMEAPWDTARYVRYKRDSEPIAEDDEAAVPLEAMIEDLATSQAALKVRLAEMSPAEFEAPATWGRGTVADMLQFLNWHETYHVGQCDLLRQVAGKNDKVI